MHSRSEGSPGFQAYPSTGMEYCLSPTCIVIVESSPVSRHVAVSITPSIWIDSGSLTWHARADRVASGADAIRSGWKGSHSTRISNLLARYQAKVTSLALAAPSSSSAVRHPEALRGRDIHSPVRLPGSSRLTFAGCHHRIDYIARGCPTPT